MLQLLGFHLFVSMYWELPPPLLGGLNYDIAILLWVISLDFVPRLHEIPLAPPRIFMRVVWSTSFLYLHSNITPWVVRVLPIIMFSYDSFTCLKCWVALMYPFIYSLTITNSIIECILVHKKIDVWCQRIEFIFMV